MKDLSDADIGRLPTEATLTFRDRTLEFADADVVLDIVDPIALVVSTVTVLAETGPTSATPLDIEAAIGVFGDPVVGAELEETDRSRVPSLVEAILKKSYIAR
jgi:hypothetical protein